MQISYSEPTLVLEATETTGTAFRPYGRFIIFFTDLPTTSPATSNWFIEAIPDGLDQNDATNWNELHQTAFDNSAGRKSMTVDGTFALHYRVRNRATGTAAAGPTAYVALIPTVTYR